MVRLALGRRSRVWAGQAALVLALGVGCGGESSSPDDVDEMAGASGDAGSSGASSGAGGTTSGGTTSRGGTTSAGGAASGGTIGNAGSTGRGGAGGSAGSSGATNGALEEIATGEDMPYWLAIDDRYVFWISGNELRRAPLSGGDIVTLATGRGLRRVAAAGGYAYFTDSLADGVGRVEREFGAYEELSSGLHPEGIFVRGDTAYWTNGGMTVGSSADGSVAMMLVDGSMGSILAEGVPQPSGVAADDEYVYFTSTSVSCTASPEGSGCIGGGVSKVPLEGGVPEPVDTEGAPFDVVVGEAGIYWAVTPARVKFAPRGGGGVSVLATLPGEDAGPIALDADAVYVSSATRGRVIKVPLDGAEPFPVAVDLGTTGGVAADADWVYVAATSEGRIVRVKKDGSAADPGGPITGPCPTPLGTPEEIAATPRDDSNLEALALELDAGEVTATQETYERVTADVARIRELEPDLSDVGFFRPHDGTTLILTPSDVAFASMQAGEYSAWDCLNDFYGLQGIELYDSMLGSPWLTIELEGNYGLDVLSLVYAELPGIETAQPNHFGGDGPTLCAERDGDVYEYVVDRAGGDCPSGCTSHEAYLFRSTRAGEVEALEAWDSMSVASAPAWFTRLCR
jgi:hypothetical protein